MAANRPDAIAEQAIDWMVQLRSGTMGERQHRRMAAWLAQDTRHRQAWEHLQNLLGDTRHLRAIGARHPGLAGDARALLLQPRRRTLLRSLLAASIALGGGLALLDRRTPLRGLSADLRTATGQRRGFDLPDGSRVVLNARSAVDLAFDDRHRRLRLRQGELLVQVAKDAARPFLVESAEGTVRALGTRFAMRQETGSTMVAVVRHSVEIIARSGARAVLGAPHTARLWPARIEYTGRSAEQEADWSNGRLSVIDVPLAEVIERLRPYRRGLLRLAPEAAALRVQGVFPLDASDRALLALSETLPIRLKQHGPITLIEAR